MSTIRAVRVLPLLMTSLLLSAPPAFAAGGGLDPSFSGNGLQLTDFAADYDGALDLAIQDDGKIVAVGYAGVGGSVEFGVARFRRGGALDTTFSGDGKRMVDLGSGSSQANAVIIQDDGKIVVAGYAETATGRDFALARLRPGGGLDPTFSGDGKKTTDLGSDLEEIYGVGVRLDGKIVVAGYTFGTDSDLALARYRPNGALDTTFSGDGRRVIDLGGDEAIWAMTLLPNGKVLGVGEAFGDADKDFLLARFRAGGALDGTFSGDGRTLTDFGGTEQANAIAIGPDGKIVLAGTANLGADDEFAVARYGPSGGLDETFSGDGKRIPPLSLAGDQAHGVVVQPDGKIVVAGYAWNGSDDDYVVVRLRPGGGFDPTFRDEDDGIAYIGFGFGHDDGFALARQPDGRLVVAGYADNGVNDDFGLVRLLA